MGNDNGFYTKVDELIRDVRFGKPHVVILGAGASLASFPKGDRNGSKLPLMSDFVEIVGLEPILNSCGIAHRERNFEEIYSELFEDGNFSGTLQQIQSMVHEYFRKLALPPTPTLYDHLVLSLRPKDVIATFNWDPFLYYACWRNHKVVRPPHTLYLHGNVAVGYCKDHNSLGWVDSECSKCGQKFEPSRLLYPIKHKGYSQDAFVKQEWDALKHYLGQAYMLTIFGYSAPKSDVEAIALMKGAWGDKYERNLEQIEIIDVKEEAELRNIWDDFIHTHHYDVAKDFYKSSIGLFPRRTCEAEWNYTMPAKLAFYPQNPIPKSMPFDELWAWYDALIQAETRNSSYNSPN